MEETISINFATNLVRIYSDSQKLNLSDKQAITIALAILIKLSPDYLTERNK